MALLRQSINKQLITQTLSEGVEQIVMLSDNEKVCVFLLTKLWPTLRIAMRPKAMELR